MLRRARGLSTAFVMKGDLARSFVDGSGTAEVCGRIEETSDAPLLRLPVAMMADASAVGLPAAATRGSVATKRTQ